MELSFGQKIDESCGLVMPWLTHGALDEISKMDLSDKIVWMWGSGLGDQWLARRCKNLYVVERTDQWMKLAASQKHDNTTYYFRPCNEGSGEQEYYCDVPPGLKPDVFIVDDAYRYECILKAISLKPCTLIVDNWQQDYVFRCPSAIDALKEWDGKYFIQPDHKDHEGNPWQTAIWKIQ